MKKYFVLVKVSDHKYDLYSVDGKLLSSCCSLYSAHLWAHSLVNAPGCSTKFISTTNASVKFIVVEIIK